MPSDIGAKIFAAAYHGKLAKLTKYLEQEDPTLLECPSVDYSDPSSGTSPLHAACQEGHADCIAFLLRAGAIVNRPGAGGITPLIVACENNRPDCVRLLLGAQANLTATDTDHGATALHGACQSGAVECVDALLDARAPVDAVDASGASPLIVAAYRGHPKCVERLLARGADEGVKYEGKTALDLAEEAGHSACVRLLDGSQEAEAAAARQKQFTPPSQEGDGDDDDDEGDYVERAKERKAGKEKASAGAPTDTANSLLDGLQQQLAGKGIKGADLIGDKRRELEQEAAKTAEEAAAREAAAKAKAAARPKSAAEAKARANAHFGAGKVVEAAEMYEIALELLEAEMVSADGSTEADVEAAAALATGNGGGGGGEAPVRAVLHCNLAACRLRQRLWREAIEACDAACDLDPHYTKALYRRAQAKRALKEYEAAVGDADAAHAALCRAGGGKPVGEVGRKTAAELDKFRGAVNAEAAADEKERTRQEMEEFGVTLGGGDGGDDEKSVYYHYASQGEKTQDFMFWMRQALRQRLNEVEHRVAPAEWRASNGYPCRTAKGAVVRVASFDPDPEGRDSATLGQLDGTCNIRMAKGRRALFLDMSMEVPWRAYVDEGTEHEQSLGGKTRLWNITHFNELTEWQHLNHRNTHEVGPAMDALAERCAPAMAAMLKVAVHECVNALVLNRIDLASLMPPPKPKPASRAWGKGTVDYSKWDNLDDDDDDDDDERVVEVH